MVICDNSFSMNEVILHEDHSTPIVAVNIWYHVGSKNEKVGRTGFAHLFEHMMFQGSENVGKGEHFGLIINRGGSANGTTSNDRTNYFETLPSHQVELGLDTVVELFRLNAEHGTTLVLVTHDRALAKRCDRQLEMDAGRLL